MDLYSYMQIEELKDIAKANGIDVPRLRGYRLMKNEEAVNISEVITASSVPLTCAKDLCESKPFWKPNPYEYISNEWTDHLKKYYLIKDKKGYYTDIRWDRIHGWKRKVLKTYIHNQIKKITNQWELWNKYAGRSDVLYIHARIGGSNWSYYSDKVVTQPWFLEKVDDPFDNTYCDIYAKITLETESKEKE